MKKPVAIQVPATVTCVTMGNEVSKVLPCFNKSSQLVPPKSLDDLAGKVDVKCSTTETQNGHITITTCETVDTTMATSPWPSSFLRTLDRTQADMFLYIVLCVAMAGNDNNNVREDVVLNNVRKKFFNENQSFQFEDTHNVVKEIKRLLPNLERLSPENKNALKKKIIGLRQDEAIRMRLEPAFRDFVKRKSLHPTNCDELKQCILSIL